MATDTVKSFMKAKIPPLTASSLLTPARLAAASGLSETSDAELLKPHEIERQRKIELLRKVRVSRDRLRFRGAVDNGDPNKVYVWVSKDEETRTSFDGMGYVVCKDPNVKTSWKKTDGTHQRGDLILYEVDKDLYEAIKLDGEMRALEEQDAEELFLNFAEQNKIPAEKLKTE